MKRFLIFSGFFFFLLPVSFASAHQPYLIDGEKRIVVNEPEISKAYYGEFTGTSTVFVIKEGKPFHLYVGISVPAILAIPHDVTAEIRKGNERVDLLRSASTDWVRFHEPYGGDDYYQGPEWRSFVTSGVYTITVSRSENSGKYVLAIGETESFTPKEFLRTISVLPSLKSQFFGEPAWTAYFNRIGLFMLLAFVVGIIAFFVIRKIFRIIERFFCKKFKKPKNIRN